ncbi:hypothetical protein [Cytophaga hutchinsonii]|jgi:hypothetical protein|uniref:Uncharacterized protein n=1 Tax=Cytophaga hutchinsonii (strain ATCC 33406 / DSM 1761 / CIP 103989 / NBRC 15051 / NCIMB 9469 / D465) TaxID=269798 RepID=A0A6N4SV70_CYTH3|nr:hypothetical protein [Cytophaga hutchinsonii]ABG60433.1 hypothetical protein CHU_3193 [Cytophaga hutchinsonii ATCC 33406]SFX86087.1 hypothetical protein SAMN04487930_11187 [Cytophaga hutchinsonii ATCC 33406]
MKNIFEKYLPHLIVVVTLIAVYQFGISKTINLYNENQELEQRLNKALTADEEILKLNSEVRYLKKQLSEYTIDSVKNKEFIFHALAEFCKSTHVQLREFPVESVANKENYIIETNKIVAEGQYGDLLKLLHFIEFKGKIGRVSSVSFYTLRDHKKQKDILLMNIYIQTLGEVL